MTNPTSDDATSNEKQFFNIHTTGIGYIQRAREVKAKGGRKAQPFLACTIAALVGPANDPVYRYFDVKVSGAEAKNLVQGYIGIDDPNKRPLVRFRLGDLWVDAFIRPKGDRKGEPAASLKARLLKAELIDPEALGQVEYHALITHGIGYLNHPKEVTPTHGDAFLACTIAALSGAVDVDELDYRYIDTVVTTTDAQQLVRRCVQAVEAEGKVLIAFRLNDMKAEPYIRTQGERAGEAAASLKSKLIHIGLIKVDGKQVYPVKAEPEVPAASTMDDGGDTVDHGSNPSTEPALPDMAVKGTC